MFQAFRSAALFVQRSFNHYDSAIHGALDETLLSQYPPIFVVGSPRTGSTVLYQVLLSQFRLAYVSNLMALMPAHMVKLARLYPKAASGFRGAYKENDYGFVAGIFSPNEAGKIIGKWFEDFAQNQGLESIRRTVLALTAASQAPLLMKNQRRLTVNIPILLNLFPESQFIITRRNPRFAAQSMLIARRTLAGGEQNWWNVMPEGYETVLDKDPIYQVLWQVMKLQEIAETCLKPLMSPNRVFVMRYEQLCEDPTERLEALQKNFSMEWRPERESLPQLRASTKIQLSTSEWQRMESHYAELRNQFEVEFPL